MTGHLFVIHGDLTRLATDAVLIPCDHALDVTDVWRRFLPPGLGRGARDTRMRLPASTPRDGDHFALPDVDGVRVAACVAVDAVFDLSVLGLADRVISSLMKMSANRATRNGRVKPLIGLPLFGTGQGGLHDRRGEVIDILLPGFVQLAADADIDVALVLHDRRDYAAVQARRDEDSGHFWAGLDNRLIESADDVGVKAGARELSLFIGAGVSVPLGMPSWPGLLTELARLSDEPYERDDASLVSDAQRLVGALTPGQFEDFMQERFVTSTHALGHALLAGFGPRQMVTTNYDPAMELALETVFGPNGYDVLTRELAHGSRPWLLKLHGDVAVPSSIVLTEEQYTNLSNERGALHGVVQSLMLTSHLLFVGFSLLDDDFLKLSTSVALVRSDAQSADLASRRAGTAVALRRDAVSARGLEEHLDVISMTESEDDVHAARKLEIFLDRVAWKAMTARGRSSHYLLDHRYDQAFAGEADQALRQALKDFERTLPPAARGSTSWPVVERTLRSLGSDVDRH